MVVLDECAFLPSDDAALPDVELVRAVRPGLARVPGSLLLAISSPYAKRGVLWTAFQKYHGVDEARVLDVAGADAADESDRRPGGDR